MLGNSVSGVLGTQPSICLIRSATSIPDASKRAEEAVREGRQPRGRLKGCACSLGEDCLHTWTFRRSKGSAKAYQDDYLFASPALSDRLDECVALEFSLDWPSDHVPIVATFR